jgi:hypothetical protein
VSWAQVPNSGLPAKADWDPVLDAHTFKEHVSISCVLSKCDGTRAILEV